MKKLFFILGVICSYCYPQFLLDKWQAIKIFFFTGYKSKQFKHIGENTILGIHNTYIGEQYISIGSNSSIGDYGRLTAYFQYDKTKQHFSPKIMLGDNCNIGPQSHITSINRIEIGNNVLTGPRVLITDNAHGESSIQMMNIAPIYRPLQSKGPVIIEDNVWIGEGAMIMPNVHIGKGCIIAANSIVTSNIPPYSIAAGIPAKVIKSLI